ncbi:MAG: signal peptidase I, partial [Gammaproteobacteria bacterium]|nr:signal peptidase I [Gammaproteobacteria bacterium]
IVEGDRIFVNKIAYDLRLPFTHISLLKVADPQRGDIIVFDSRVSGVRLVKRVVGMPGDVVQMRNNALVINHRKLYYQTTRSSPGGEDRIEDLFGIKHSVRVLKNGSRAANFAALSIPEDFYLVLGDNRDNSADSRFIGLVPRKEIVGRTRTVVMSLDYDNYYLPRSDRLLRAL